MTGIVSGVTLIGIALALFFAGLPRQDRTVRPFLKADFAQGLYAVVIVGLGTSGLITSLASWASAAD